MAKPDTDDGWIKMAHELHAALAFADFTKAQQVVLDYVFSQSFGPAKRRVVDLSPSDLATLTGLDKGSVGHAIAGLVSDGVLVKAALCRYVFAKDYERWQKGGKPRLRPVEVAYIKGAPTRSMAFHKGSKSLAAQPTEALVNEPTGPLVNQPTALAIEPTGVGQRANESLVNEPTKSASPHTPLYGREKGDIRGEEEKTPPTPQGGAGGRAGLETVDQATDGRIKMPPSLPPMKVYPADEIARVEAVADELDPFKNGGWRTLARQRVGQYPPSWVIEALRAGYASNARHFKLIDTILERYEDEGGPRRQGPKRSQDGPPPGVKFSQVGQPTPKPFDPEAQVFNFKIPEPGAKVGGW
jgi:hypothetical protein